MTRSASIEAKRSGIFPLLAGVISIVAALGIAVIAAKPSATSTAATPIAAASVQPAGAPTRAGQGLAAREMQYDFGSISMAAGNVSHRYWFRNEGATPVMIQRIYTSCMCTSATLVKGMRVVGRYGMAGHGPLPEVNESLAPNEAAYLDVVFDPAAHGPAGLGHTERIVTIEPAGGEPLQVGFVANVRP